MLKLSFMMLFISPICFINGLFWMVQNLLFVVTFIFIMFNYCTNYFVNISYFLGFDVISYELILLSFWICTLMLTACESVNKYSNYKSLFLFNVLIFLVLTFSSLNLFMFYLFFESSLIPTLFLIWGWEYQPERLQAGVYLLFYTLLVSLPMLVGIFYLYNNLNTMNVYLFLCLIMICCI